MLSDSGIAGEAVSPERNAFSALQSTVAGVIWPPLAAGDAAMLAALMHQLEQTQWLAAEAIIARQREQLLALATHAYAHSAYFRGRLQAAGLQPGDLATRDGLRKLPIMSRRDVQAAQGTLFCTQIPAAHAPVVETRTSGSSGEPVMVKRTALSQLFWLALTLREHLWQQRNFRGKLAIIRANLGTDQVEQANWGPPASLLFVTGSSHALSITADISKQIEWLRAVDPDYFLVYPSNLAALLDRFEAQGLRLPALRQIRTIGETLTPVIRAQANRVLGVDIADTYSSQEAGIIALQCPVSGQYHAMAESLIVEVLDDQGGQCVAGQVGRVVVTDLHNFATPLVRYDLGDYAEAGAVCSCGRGLPTIARIVGRERNLVRLRDGRRHWPLVGFHRYREIAPIRQYQLIQRDLVSIEVRLVADAPLTADQEQRLGEVIRASLGFAFGLQFVYFEDAVPRGPGGKFEEFLCEAK